MTIIKFANGYRYQLQDGETASWLTTSAGGALIVCHPDRRPKMVTCLGGEKVLEPAGQGRPVAAEWPAGDMPGFSASKDRGDGGERLMWPGGKTAREYLRDWFLGRVVEPKPFNASPELKEALRRAEPGPIDRLMAAYPEHVWIGWDLAAPGGDKTVVFGGPYADGDELPDMATGGLRDEAFAKGEQWKARAKVGGDYDGKPIINAFDVERLARRLCLADSGDPEAFEWHSSVGVVTYRKEGDLAPRWCMYEEDAKRILREEWAKREAWGNHPPSFYHRLGPTGGLK